MFLFKVLILLFCSHVTALGYMILSSAIIFKIFFESCHRACAHARAPGAECGTRYYVHF